MNDSVPGSVIVDLRLAAGGRAQAANVGGRQKLTSTLASAGWHLHPGSRPSPSA